MINFFCLILGLNDLLITPLYIAIMYGIWGFFLKSFTKNKLLLQYKTKIFIIKTISVICFALIHEFIYGGDTVNYTKNSATILYNKFMDEPMLILNMIFAFDKYNPIHINISNQLVFSLNSGEALVVKISTVLAIFTINTYSSISLIMGIFALSGLWAIFIIFTKHYPHLHSKFAIAFFYIPSVVFWSSGVLKDTLCLGAMGWLFWSMYNIFFNGVRSPMYFIVLIFSFLLLQNVKVYIILCFIPAITFWLFIQYTESIKNFVIKTIITPIFFTLGIVGAFYGATQITKNDEKYSLDKIGQTTKSTAEWIHYVSKTQNGSSYTLGTLDGTFAGMLKLAPQAINVALFRPYLWEVRNIPMFISAIESLIMLFFTIYILIKVGIFRTFTIISSTPIVLFCFIFALTFAFAVGISSYNFGTLVRYKIPLMPFYVAGLYIMDGFIEKKRKKRKAIQNDTI